MKNSDLADLARNIAEKAYAPYSNFRVGAALITDSGNIYTGAILKTHHIQQQFVRKMLQLLRLYQKVKRVLTQLRLHVLMLNQTLQYFHVEFLVRD